MQGIPPPPVMDRVLLLVDIPSVESGMSTESGVLGETWVGMGSSLKGNCGDWKVLGMLGCSPA